MREIRPGAPVSAEVASSAAAPDFAPLGTWQPEDTVREINAGLLPFAGVQYPPDLLAEELPDAINVADVIKSFVYATYALSVAGRRPGWDNRSEVLANGTNLSMEVEMGDAGLLIGRGGNYASRLQFSLSVPFQRSADGRALFVPDEDAASTMPTACVVDPDTGKTLIYGYQSTGIGELAPGQRGEDPMAVIIAMQCLASDTARYLQSTGGEIIADRYSRDPHSLYVPVAEFNHAAISGYAPVDRHTDEMRG